MLALSKVHHVAIICKDYGKSRDFYTRILGLTIRQEIYREQRDSHKCDLMLNGQFVIELFSFPDPPERPSWPEAVGLRHLAFEVDDIDQEVKKLRQFGIDTEPIRTDPYTDKRFVFFADPDGLPIELYER